MNSFIWDIGFLVIGFVSGTILVFSKLNQKLAELAENEKTWKYKDKHYMIVEVEVD